MVRESVREAEDRAPFGMTTFRASVLGGLGLGFGFTIAELVTEVAFAAAETVGTPAFQQTAKAAAGAMLLVGAGIAIGVVGVWIAFRGGVRGGS